MRAPDTSARAGTAASPFSRVVALPLIYKGLIASLLLVLYGGLMAAYVLGQQELLARERATIDDQREVEDAFRRAGLAVSNALLGIQSVPIGEDLKSLGVDAVPFALEAAERALAPWRTSHPSVFDLHRLVRARLEDLRAQVSRATLLELRDSLQRLASAIERDGALAGERHQSLARVHRDHGDRVTLTALALGIGGLVFFGGAATLFFAKLATDVRVLGQRAQEIVGGYRGDPLEVSRRDEVGALTRAVNRMAADLAGRERELDLARERRTHREKMAALGAMARNLSHEIGNPLATISAVLQNAQAAAGGAACNACQPDVILEQTRRIAQITRQIADFTGPRTGAPEPMDAGVVLRAVCDFMQFDPRFQGIRVEARIARELPLVEVVPDELSEAVMNLLLLAADGSPRLERLEVAASASDAEVALHVPVGGLPAAATPRRDRVAQLARAMRGRLEALDGAYELRLPVIETAALRS